MCLRMAVVDHRNQTVATFCNYGQGHIFLLCREAGLLICLSLTCYVLTYLPLPFSYFASARFPLIYETWPNEMCSLSSSFGFLFITLSLVVTCSAKEILYILAKPLLPAHNYQDMDPQPQCKRLRLRSVSLGPLIHGQGKQTLDW